MTRIKIHISNVKLPFYPPCEVKYRLQNGVSTISNLLFADDSLLFCQANQGEVQVLMDILDLYASASSQCINFEKS